MVHEIENFFGVYLLYCLNERYKGRTYVGFTVNPNRRIKQHNLGSEKGGARKTSGRGPWEMVLIVHGFPNMISALRFEWAWQNPDRSRRLRDLPKKRKKENAFQFKFRTVSEMLRTAPWCRLPLTIRWLKQDYREDFPADSNPPTHMPVVFGPVSVKSVKPGTSYTENGEHEDTDELPVLTQRARPRCAVCAQKMTISEENTLKCLKPACRMVSHTLCLARHFLGPDASDVLPIEGQCPSCKTMLLWGDLIRFKAGCYQNMSQNQSIQGGDDSDDSTLEHWTDVINT